MCSCNLVGGSRRVVERLERVVNRMRDVGKEGDNWATGTRSSGQRDQLIQL